MNFENLVIENIVRTLIVTNDKNHQYKLMVELKALVGAEVIPMLAYVNSERNLTKTIQYQQAIAPAIKWMSK